jgi:hypothetical protein
MPGLVPPINDEREGLLGYLAQQREAFRIVAYGLTDERVPTDGCREGWPGSPWMQPWEPAGV